MPLTLPQVLEAISGELLEQAQMARRLDDVLGELSDASRAGAELQSVDRLRQSLDALANLVANLANQTRDSRARLDQVALSHGVELEAIRALIAPQADKSSADEISLFP